MDIKLHKQATTTPKIRSEIQAAPVSASESALARQYGAGDSAIRRWDVRLLQPGLNSSPIGISPSLFAMKRATYTPLPETATEHVQVRVLPERTPRHKRNAIWANYQRSSQAYAGDGIDGQDGMSYYRSVAVPPIALGLSLFFSLVALLKLPLILNELVYANILGKHDYRGWAQAALIGGILVINRSLRHGPRDPHPRCSEDAGGAESDSG